MANITPYTSQISSAIYGEEVRGSIVSALQAMNSDINFDLTTMQNLEDSARSLKNETEGIKNQTQTLRNQTETLRNQAQDFATTASQEGNKALVYSNAARDYSASAQTHEIAAKAYSDSAALKEEQAAESASKAKSDRIASDDILRQVQNLMSQANYENIYNYVRKQVLLSEGYEVDRSIEDSNGEAILDSSGNPIIGRKILDPMIFEDTFEYVMKHFMQEQILNVIFSMCYEFVLSSLYEESLFKSWIYESVRSGLYQDSGFWDKAYAEMKTRMGTYEYVTEVLDSSDENVLDSNNQNINGRTLFYIAK